MECDLLQLEYLQESNPGIQENKHYFFSLLHNNVSALNWSDQYAELYMRYEESHCIVANGGLWKNLHFGYVGICIVIC